MIYNELPITVDKEYLINIFKNNQGKLKKYAIRNSNNEILGHREYYELYFSFKEGKDIFYNIFPYECRGYQYVYMPPNYEMVIHKDISYLKCRIGCLLLGSATIKFYDDDKSLISEYDYKKPILFNTQVLHNVINLNEFRLTFFVNFEDSFDVMRDRIKNNRITIPPMAAQCCRNDE